MLTVACVLSEGPNRTYNYSHVKRLMSQVKENLKQPYEFVCVTDSPLSGWWTKIDLWKPGRFHGRVLYLDLDITVTGNLDDLADFAAPFTIIKDWTRIGYNSSVMAWDAGYLDSLYTKFNNAQDESNDMAHYAGDQDYIWAKMHGEATFPKPWCRSFKRTVLLHEPIDDMRAMIFHGWPKPWDVARLV